MPVHSQVLQDTRDLRHSGQDSDPVLKAVACSPLSEYCKTELSGVSGQVRVLRVRQFQAGYPVDRLGICKGSSSPELIRSTLTKAIAKLWPPPGFDIAISVSFICDTENEHLQAPDR